MDKCLLLGHLQIEAGEKLTELIAGHPEWESIIFESWIACVGKLVHNWNVNAINVDNAKISCVQFRNSCHGSAAVLDRYIQDASGSTDWISLKQQFDEAYYQTSKLLGAIALKTADIHRGNSLLPQRTYLENAAKPISSSVLWHEPL